MSYTMDFEEEQAIQKDDTVVEYEGFKLVTDAMSLLYLFGGSFGLSALKPLILSYAQLPENVEIGLQRQFLSTHRHDDVYICAYYC